MVESSTPFHFYEADSPRAAESENHRDGSDDAAEKSPSRA
jgi:hypothetical protein